MSKAAAEPEIKPPQRQGRQDIIHEMPSLASSAPCVDSLRVGNLSTLAKPRAFRSRRGPGLGVAEERELRGRLGVVLRQSRHDLGARGGVRGEDAVEADHVQARRRHPSEPILSWIPTDSSASEARRDGKRRNRQASFDFVMPIARILEMDPVSATNGARVER